MGILQCESKRLTHVSLIVARLTGLLSQELTSLYQRGFALDEPLFRSLVCWLSVGLQTAASLLDEATNDAV